MVGTEFWSGAGGAIIGTVGAAVVALVVMFATRAHDRRLMRDEMSVRAAYECYGFLRDIIGECDDLVAERAAVDPQRVRRFARRHSDAFKRLDVWANLMGPQHLVYSVRELAEAMGALYAPRLREVAERGSMADLDEVCMDAADHAGGVCSVLDTYMRQDYRRGVDRLREARGRYRLTPSWPFVVRKGLVERLREGPTVPPGAYVHELEPYGPLEAELLGGKG